jgi:LysM repeat protein
MKALVLSPGVALLWLLVVTPATGQSLRGSKSSVARQYRMAQVHDFTFLRSARQISDFVRAGYLVTVRGDENYTLANVSYPYARPEVKLFLERLSAQYRAACSERLVVTSLTRPRNDQPNNASSRSVHPTGMAVDIRRSRQRACRSWIEKTLASLERNAVLEATRERYPPHYHVAVFPEPYSRYVAMMPDKSVPTPAEVIHYRVRRGDSLWSIARDYGTDVDSLKAVNNLAGSRIYAGQTLRIPSAS